MNDEDEQFKNITISKDNQINKSKRNCKEKTRKLKEKILQGNE